MWFHLSEVLRIVKITESEGRMVVASGWAAGGGCRVVDWYGLSALQEEKGSRDVGDGDGILTL